MFNVIFRAFLFLFVVFWYSLGVWRLIDDYFRTEFKRQLDVEYKQNVHLRPAVVAAAGDEDVSAQCTDPHWTHANKWPQDTATYGNNLHSNTRGKSAQQTSFKVSPAEQSNRDMQQFKVAQCQANANIRSKWTPAEQAVDHTEYSTCERDAIDTIKP